MLKSKVPISSLGVDLLNYKLVIPDVHGDHDALNSSLKRAFDFARDSRMQINDLIFLGDYVDRGDYSFEVITKIESLKNDFNVTTLIGNHECLMLKCLILKDFRSFVMWTFNGGVNTLKSFVLEICPEYSSLMLDLDHIFRFGYKKSAKPDLLHFYTENYTSLIALFERILKDDNVYNFFKGLSLSLLDNENFYIHGGIDMNFIENRGYGVDSWVDEMNSEFDIALNETLSDSKHYKLDMLDGVSKSSGGSCDASPVWFREKDFSSLTDVEKLITEDYLLAAGISRMFVGHSIVDSVKRFVFPSGLSVWFLDVGMSEHYDTYFEKAGMLVPCKDSLDLSKSFERQAYNLDSFGYFGHISNILKLEDN